MPKHLALQTLHLQSVPTKGLMKPLNQASSPSMTGAGWTKPAADCAFRALQRIRHTKCHIFAYNFQQWLMPAVDGLVSLLALQQPDRKRLFHRHLSLACCIQKLDRVLTPSTVVVQCLLSKPGSIILEVIIIAIRILLGYMTRFLHWVVQISKSGSKLSNTSCGPLFCTNGFSLLEWHAHFSYC